jgi:hypothetical protein
MDISNNSVINTTKVEDECIELKHLKYKTMIQTGINTVIENDKSINDMNILEKYLNDTTETNKTERWNKLDKTIKMKKIMDFIDGYSEENNYSESEKLSLIVYLKDCLDKKKLMRVKDVVYDNNTDTLMSIPGLQYNKTSKKHTIKNTDGKRVSVLKSLPQRKTLKKDNTTKKDPVNKNGVN